MRDRRSVLAGLGAILSAGALGGPAAAHHGWLWTLDGLFELTGVLTSVRLGNPHGVLKVDIDGEIWTVEVGYPAQNYRAGLTDDLFVVGKDITIVGQRAEDETLKWVKARRLSIDGQLYDLYPDPDPK